ncbi:uracil-DNA glycosylase [Nocardia huaxiensis]|uniref:Type-5 uracil-DNA glycosylase n=1 Tax=Nocardia huaxiensis TaxID=2755382 RepID=A0A7D6VDL6_9NOCA|nr:uracil-DNA glycosylase [Nocardia huaxiensis]QLY32533.1 uracil-DNA glycosylase [Nocardia huaxiensis]
MCRTIAELDHEITECRACPRLVAWREQVARDKRAAFRDETYWGRPVPSFGPGDARLLVVGLAPAAHGGNRTGRMFTGDRAADVLIAAMYRAGLANQPTSTHPDDGLRLLGTRVTAPVHCAPPDNKPTPGERDNCRHWLDTELQLLRPSVRAIVVLGGWGWQALFPALAESGWAVPKPRPKFGHGAHVTLASAVPAGAPLEVFGCYHPSQQNTFTGRLTPAMIEAVLVSAATAAGLRPRP